MILLFSDWVLSKPQGGLLGYQYDNLTRELAVQGDLPEGWTWDMLVSASGNSDTWPLALGDGQASITLTDDNLSVRGEYYLQLRGTNGDQVRHTNVITAYNSRSLSGAGQWPTLPTEWIQAEKDIKELNAHPPVPGSNGYWLLWDLSSHSYQESDLPVPVGPAGPPNVLEIGTVETLPADKPATASITGESPAQKLNLGIPQGQPGKDGPANTLQIGTVETLEPGQAATAQITGEAPDQTLSLGIPQGQTGKTGATPALEIGQVETLEPGEPATAEFSGTPEKPVLSLGIPQGQPGKDGPANTLSIGQVETLEPGEPATAQITGEAPNQTLSLGIPQGQTGQTGATPALEIGQVETLEPGEPATAELSGTPEAPVLSLGIPQGQPGQDGVQLNDSAINTTEAWSSKKIVDTLCPAFTVEGNPVTCQPVEGYPLGVKVSFSPRQEGEGDPSPENVRPITGYDSVTVTQSKDEAQVKQITLTLPETIYGGTVDAVTGVGEKTWEFVEFDGTEGWILYRDRLENCETFCLAISGAQNGFFTSVCNCFKNVVRSWQYDTPWQYSDHASNNYKYFVVPISEIPDLDSWKSYLAAQAAAGTPVQIAYKLATPEPFQATGNQALPAVAGLNTLYTDGDSLTVTGRRDLVSALEDLQTTMTAVTTLISEGGLT